jgi:hypothetical protein
MLIDTREPPPSEPQRPVWEPDARTSAWTLLAIGTAVACFATGGVASFVLLCCSVGFAAAAISRALPYGSGLREHRQ